MLKQALIASVLAVAASAAPVFAQAPAVSSVVDWNGYFVGVEAGAGFGATRFTTGLNPIYGSLSQVGTLSDTAFVGGLRGGYNYQVGNYVVGVVTDANLTSSSASVVYGVGAANLGYKSEIPFFGTIRGRLGFAYDKALLYGTGGFAYGTSKAAFSFSDGFGNQIAGAKDRIDGGWTAGAGVEYAIAPHWSTTVEYLHVGLAANRFADTVAAFDNVYRPSVEKVTAGVNYKW